ncbi:MAG TPA: hypothetical protein DDY91_01335 [Planctomycetaceae bacterium]|nr:hypothetical protein [Planctomycetaceae bacterium]
MSEETVIDPRRDIGPLMAEFASDAHTVEPLDPQLGHHPLARRSEFPPCHFKPQLRLALMGFVTTSVGLIIQKKQS